MMVLWNNFVYLQYYARNDQNYHRKIIVMLLSYLNISQLKLTMRGFVGTMSLLTVRTYLSCDALDAKSAISSIPCAIVFLVAYLFAFNLDWNKNFITDTDCLEFVWHYHVFMFYIQPTLTLLLLGFVTWNALGYLLSLWL